MITKITNYHKCFCACCMHLVPCRHTWLDSACSAGSREHLQLKKGSFRSRLPVAGENSCSHMELSKAKRITHSLQENNLPNRAAMGKE
jgi:hypothetical protein